MKYIKITFVLLHIIELIAGIVIVLNTYLNLKYKIEMTGDDYVITNCYNFADCMLGLLIIVFVVSTICLAFFIRSR